MINLRNVHPGVYGADRYLACIPRHVSAMTRLDHYYDKKALGICTKMKGIGFVRTGE